MIYFTTNSDGNNTEGIGAMAQYQIICYCLSQLYNTNFYFTGFKNLTHYQYFDIPQNQWCGDITNFFNLPISKEINLPIIGFHQLNEDLELFINKNNNIIINFESNYLMSFIDSFIDNEDIQCILKTLGNNVVLKDELKYFSKEKQNVAIHIRRFMPTDCDPNPRRELFDKSKENYYIDLMNQLNNNSEFHIYSQGKEEDFIFLKKDNVVLHIEENPLVSLYHMIKADILVTANSSLSYVAHLLGNHKKCFVRDTFFHKWKLSNSNYINYEYRNS